MNLFYTWEVLNFRYRISYTLYYDLIRIFSYAITKYLFILFIITIIIDTIRSHLIQ